MPNYIMVDYVDVGHVVQVVDMLNGVKGPPLPPSRPLASAHTHTFPTARPELSELLLPACAQKVGCRSDCLNKRTSASDETVQVQRASDGQFGVHIHGRRHRSRHLLPRHCRWRVCFARDLFCRNRHTNPLAL